MDRIWAPWRLGYIQSENKVDGCVFCHAGSEQNDEKNLIVERAAHCMVMLNRYPYTSGHVMVIPFKHGSDLTLHDADTRSEMMALTEKWCRIIGEAYHPHGFNIGANIGKAAGAGIAEHLHLHIVPRWSGDVNFTTTVGNTRVLPEDLADSYARLVNAARKLKY
mgnify:CR=1 FL=1